MLIGEK